MNKKTIIISSIIIILIVIGVVCFIFFGNKNTKDENYVDTKTARLYDKLEEKGMYTFSMEVDNYNKLTIVRKDDKAYVDSYYKGKNDKYIVRDENTYLLVENTKKYYEYENNTQDLSKINLIFEDFKTSQYTEGEEEINGKKYKYEEYEGVSNFLIGHYEDIQDVEVKTRLYYSGDKLVYVKTLIGKEEELIKIEYSFNADEKLFEIPSDYTQG